MDILDKTIYVVTGIEDSNNFVEEFINKERLEMWINYRKSISSSFKYTISERKPKNIFDCVATYEARWFPTGVVINGYAELAPGIKCGLSRGTWIPDSNPTEVIYRELETLTTK